MTALKYAHLGIDYQKTDGNKLSPERWDSFIKEGRSFADDLRKKDILTIWILWGDENKYQLLLPSAPKNQRQKAAKTYNLDANLKVKDDEAMYLKGSNNAFACQPCILSLYLQELNVNGLIVTGSNTPACIKETLWSIKKYTDNVIAIYDQMADEKLS